MDRPLPLVSYAQNREDIVLARGFTPWNSTGTWIDVGAGHPRNDSVTYLFSQLGWTGINIEPLRSEFEMLQLERPRDFNFNCVVSEIDGVVPFFIAPESMRGCSTLDPAIAEQSSPEERFEKTTVDSRQIMAIVEEVGIKEIDFLKVDVEGAELAVLSTFDFARCRPRCVVVEATIPNTSVSSHKDWDEFLVDAEYDFVLFDGINRFYVHRSEDFLKAALAYPACVLDRYVTRHEFEFQATIRELINSSTNQGQHIRHIEESLAAQVTYINSLKDHLSKKTSELEILNRTRVQDQVTQIEGSGIELVTFGGEELGDPASHDEHLRCREELVELQTYIATQERRIQALEERNIDLFRIAEERLPGILRLERIERAPAFRIAIKARQIVRRIARWTR